MNIRKKITPMFLNIILYILLHLVWGACGEKLVNFSCSQSLETKVYHDFVNFDPFIGQDSFWTFKETPNLDFIEYFFRRNVKKNMIGSMDDQSRHAYVVMEWHPNSTRSTCLLHILALADAFLGIEHKWNILLANPTQTLLACDFWLSW